MAQEIRLYEDEKRDLQRRQTDGVRADDQVSERIRNFRLSLHKGQLQVQAVEGVEVGPRRGNR